MSLEQAMAELNENLVKLIEVMGNGAGAAEEEPEEKPKRGRGKAAPVKKTAPKRGASKAKKGPTLNDVRNAIRKVSKEVDSETADEIMGEFDVEKVTELEESDYQEFIEACEEALEE